MKQKGISNSSRGSEQYWRSKLDLANKYYCSRSCIIIIAVLVLAAAIMISAYFQFVNALDGSNKQLSSEDQKEKRNLKDPHATLRHN